MKTTDQLYEELRAVVDNGHESMTHDDALAHVRALRDDNWGVTATALNILDGMEHLENWELLQSAWENEGMGFIEFTRWIAELAELAVADLNKREPQNFPGVWDYEVSCHVGGLITKHVVSTGALPSTEEVERWFQISSDEFFEQGEKR